MTKLRLLLYVGFIGVALTGITAAADLRDQLDGIFKTVLDLHLSPGSHGNHFKTDNSAVNKQIRDALTSYISGNLSSFPLSSTGAGLTFDFSSGVPVAATTSAGPIFTERAQTLGKKVLNVGMNFTHMPLTRIRGIKTQDIKFTFLHEDELGNGMGDDPNEFDTIELQMKMDITANVAAMYATYGVSDKLDVGLAVPFISINMKANPTSRINSHTLEMFGYANHFYDTTALGDPILTLTPPAIDESATGIGDIALRAKYMLAKSEKTVVSGLFEARLATGDEKNFLGTGDASYKFGVLVSGSEEGYIPHMNLTYNIHSSAFQRDQVNIGLGYDYRLGQKFTLVAEWLGNLEVGEEIKAYQFPGAVSISTISSPTGNPVVSRTVSPTNIPNYKSDNINNASFGLKYAASSSVLFMADVLLPTNSGGMRAEWVPTIGIQASF